MTDKEIFDKIASIASKYSGLPVEKLNLDSSVNHDLRIDGDDIEDMIADIDDALNLNFDGFVYSRYFQAESEINTIKSIVIGLRNLLGFTRDCPSDSYDFRLGDFVRWIKNGYWEEKHNETKFK